MGDGWMVARVLAEELRPVREFPLVRLAQQRIKRLVLTGAQDDR